MALVLALVTGVLSLSALRGDTPTIPLMPPPFPHPMVVAIDPSWPMDEAGIVRVPYATGLQYNALTVAQYALRYYELWKQTGLPDERVRFLRYADWLVDHQDSDGLWRYRFPFASMPVPWVSALTQGQAISVLARASAETLKPSYARSAHAAMSAFLRPAGSGGVTSRSPDGVFFEEYEAPFSPHTLNGMVLAMYGLRDAAVTWQDDDATRLWNEGVQTLLRNLDRWDAGDWSYYNLANPPERATTFYQQLHVQLMSELGVLTGRAEFSRMAERWKRDLTAHPAPSPSAILAPHG